METAMGPHYELTDETMEWEGRTLHRIRATRDLETQYVKKGELGGWVESIYNLRDTAWAFDSSKVYGSARMSGNSSTHHNSQVFGFAVMQDHARTYNESKAFGDAWLCARSMLQDTAQAFGNCRIYGSVVDAAKVSGSVCIDEHIQISGDAELLKRQHLLILGPIGSESSRATLYRTKTGHRLEVGCWEDGTVGELMDEVEQRREDGWAHRDEAERWVAEYAALKALCEIRIASWHSADDKPAD